MRHDIKNDPQVLQLLGFILHTSIRGILDVGRIASKIPPNISITLSSILSELGCPFQNLHTAGNDAYFTLLYFTGLTVISNKRVSRGRG